MNKFIYSEDKHSWFKNLILYLHADSLPIFQDIEEIHRNNPDKTIKEIIKDLDAQILDEYVEIFDKEYINKTIDEGRQILSLKDFPGEWIGNTTIRYPYFNENEATDEDYYQWIKWAIDTLEEKAKRAGKI